MGKTKIKIQKIEKESNRRVTFNKRRIGLLKKAYEISILCDVDIALIFSSQNGEITCFEGPRSSVEEVVMKFANIPEHERAKSHIRKYTVDEGQLWSAMPRNIENEEMFQAVARKLYQSHPGLTSLSESDRSIQMEHLHHVSTQEIIKEIKDIQRFIGLYDLSLPIGDLISSRKDAAQMEFYIQRQLQKLQNFKIMSSQIPAVWLDSQIDNRKAHGAGSTYMNRELSATIVDNNTQVLGGWDTFSLDMEILYDGVSTDQIPSRLPELSESNSDFLPSSIEDDIIDHEFFKDIGGHDSFQKDSGAFIYVGE